MVPQDNQIFDERKLIFIEVFQIIDEEGMIERKYHPYATLMDDSM